MKCVPSSNSVIVGTIDGKVMLVDIREADKPRLVFEKILHKGPLTALGYAVFILPTAFSRIFHKKLLVTNSSLRPSREELQYREDIFQETICFDKGNPSRIFTLISFVSCIIILLERYLSNV